MVVAVIVMMVMMVVVFVFMIMMVMAIIVFGVIVMMMSMIVMITLCHSVYNYVNTAAAYTLFFSFYRTHNRIFQTDCVHFLYEFIGVGTKLHESRHQHIARGAHVAFNV